MVSSGGGGSAKAPNSPSPVGAGAIPYGETAPFNPAYTSVLGADWATPESVDAGLARGKIPSNPVQQQNAVNPQIGLDAMKAQLAQMMAGQQYGNAVQNARIGAMPGGGGGGAPIGSFGTLRSILNPNLSWQQKQSIMNAGRSGARGYGSGHS